MLNGTWEVFKKANLARTLKNSAEYELSELEEQQGRLESNIERLGTDWGIEQEVREKFGVAKEGEEVVVIVDGEDAGDGENVSKKSLWSRIKSLFK